MKNSVFISCVALFVAAAGVVIALAAYFKNRAAPYGYDDEDDFLFDDDDLEYYSSEPEGNAPSQKPHEDDLSF